MPTEPSDHTFLVFCADADGRVGCSSMIEAPTIDGPAVRAVCVEVAAKASDKERVFVARVVISVETCVKFSYL